MAVTVRAFLDNIEALIDEGRRQSPTLGVEAAQAVTLYRH